MRATHPGKSCILLLFMVISAFLVLSENSSALPNNKVKNIKFDQQAYQETVLVFLETLPEIRFFTLQNPERIVVDIKNAFVPQVSIFKKTRGEAIKNIRIGQNKKDTARIVLDICRDIQYDFKIAKAISNDKPMIKIIVSLVPKNEKQATIEPENNLVLFTDSISDDLFIDTDKQAKKSNFSISGILHVRTSLQARKEDAIENNTSLRKRIQVETKYKNMMTVSVLSDYLFFGSENKTSDYDLTLHEAKWQYTEKNYGLSLGRQIIRWGKTDQISPVDTLNPQDLREFILPDYEERKIPVWMADLNLFFDKFTMEGVFIPFFKKSRIDYFGTNWSIFGHVKKELQNANISPSLLTYFDNIHVHEKDPDTEAEFALRLKTTIKNIDLGATFHHTIEDTPYFTNFPIKNINANGRFSAEGLTSALDNVILIDENIEVAYKRTNIAGFEFETTLGVFGVRGEAAWQENESFLTSSLTSTRKPTLIYVFGTDYTTTENTYLNIQFAHRHISNYSSEILYFEQNTYSLLGEIRMDIISEWLQASLKYTKILNNNSWYLSPQLKYTYITNLDCILGASIFSGDKNTWFGSFKDLDFFFVDISYRF